MTELNTFLKYLFKDCSCRVDRIPACDGQTDRQTLPQHSPRYACKSRGKIITRFVIHVAYTSRSFVEIKTKLKYAGVYDFNILSSASIL